MNEVVHSRKDSVNLFNVVNRLRTGGYAFACALCASGHKPTRRLFNAVRGKKNEVKLCVLLFPHYLICSQEKFWIKNHSIVIPYAKPQIFL